MRIQFASDLHLEFYAGRQRGPDFFATLVTPGQDAEILVLAGDIGYAEKSITRDFLTWCCANWPLVVWVYGNHEYYSKGATMAQKEEAGAAIAASLPNLRILHDETFELEGTDLTILGATLWTDLRDGEAARIQGEMADFEQIWSEEGVRFTPDDWSALHWASRGFLEGALEEVGATGRRAVVVTHHLPSHRMILPQYRGHPLNCGFAARADALVDHPAVAAWICGHSHGQFSVGRCHLNARGYPREGSVVTYNEAACIDL